LNNDLNDQSLNYEETITEGVEMNVNAQVGSIVNTLYGVRAKHT